MDRHKQESLGKLKNMITSAPSGNLAMLGSPRLRRYLLKCEMMMQPTKRPTISEWTVIAYMFLSLGIIIGAVLIYFGHNVKIDPTKTKIADFMINSGWGAFGISISYFIIWKTINKLLR